MVPEVWGGLAGAVLAYQAHDLAGVDFQLHALQGLGATEGLGDVLGAEQHFCADMMGRLCRLDNGGLALVPFQLAHIAAPLTC